MVENRAFIEVYKKNAAELGIKETEPKGVARGSTDMGNVSHVVPSIHPTFYIGSDAVNHTRPMTAAVGEQLLLTL